MNAKGIRVFNQAGTEMNAEDASRFLASLAKKPTTGEQERTQEIILSPGQITTREQERAWVRSWFKIHLPEPQRRGMQRRRKRAAKQIGLQAEHLNLDDLFCIEYIVSVLSDA